MLLTSQAPASALDDFIPGFHETFTAWVLQSCDRDELHCGGGVVVMWWCGVVRAVGGGDMKIDVAVAPISCSGNFLTNHAAGWAGPGSTHPEAITSSSQDTAETSSGTV